MTSNTAKKYDVVVVGGGPAGMMAAISAAEGGGQVLLVEKNEVVGKKLALTGGSRCNLTTSLSTDEIIENTPGNGRFLYSALNRWDNNDIIAFFKGLGVKLKEEDRGRIFPVSNDAQTIVSALRNRMAELQVEVIYNSRVSELLTDQISEKYIAGTDETNGIVSSANVASEPQSNDVIVGTDPQSTKTTAQTIISGVKLQSGETIKARNVIIATGGKSFPATGSTGDGYELAKTLGHTIKPLSPGEVPLTSEDPFTKKDRLQGLSLQDISVSVLNAKGKKLITHRNDLLFTHFGLSGPAILSSSTFALKELEKQNQSAVEAKQNSSLRVQRSNPHADFTRPCHSECNDVVTVELSLDILPDRSTDEIVCEIEKCVLCSGDKSLRNGLRDFLPERLLLYFLINLDINPDRKLKTLTPTEAKSLAALCKNFIVNISGSLPLDKAFVTCGGVSLKEINPKTMESKLVSGLYFCGEILDVNGYTGGFNLTAAFTTGHLAGMASAATAI
ncbi:MAG: NAD(P)/FAD-dependent oxidoreductase [Clostridiales Family XIII bacterium]|nr:NAD(P)/FAD-dependent oxidoreductase [Clostridiales Family XIII bacterium]